MSDKQYQVLLDLYHEFNEAFLTLDQAVKSAFFDRLYAK